MIGKNLLTPTLITPREREDKAKEINTAEQVRRYNLLISKIEFILHNASAKLEFQYEDPLPDEGYLHKLRDYLKNCSWELEIQLSRVLGPTKCTLNPIYALENVD